MTAKRTKKTIISGVTPERAEIAFSDFATADARIAEINALIDLEIIKIRDSFAFELKELTERKDKAFEVVQIYAMENKDTLFAKKRSIETIYGAFGFRTGTPKLKTLKGFNWPAVTKLLKTTMPDYVRVTEEPAKDKLLADRDKKGFAKKLEQVGIKVIQDESFYVERKTEEVPA